MTGQDIRNRFREELTGAVASGRKIMAFLLSKDMQERLSAYYLGTAVDVDSFDGIPVETEPRLPDGVIGVRFADSRPSDFAVHVGALGTLAPEFLMGK